MVSLIVNGHDGYSFGHGNQRIEMIKENGDTIVLPKSSEYPLDARKTAGASLPDKSFVICGGHVWFLGKATSECYKLTNGQWELFGKLQTARWEHAASPIGHAIWFTGGRADGYVIGDTLPTTEILNSDGTVTWGPILPAIRYNHCQATYEDTTLIIGGKHPFNHYHS